MGDPFKDTSGPALNILIKLMSMISLTIAPLLRDRKEWDHWYYGLIPIGLCLFGTIVVYQLYWKNAQDITAPVSSVKKADVDEEGQEEEPLVVG